YSHDGTVGGILVVLEGSDFTHTDPKATGAAPWPATGYNQANDIMQPFLDPGAIISAQDQAVLNNAFDWITRGLNIQLVNLDPVDLNGQPLSDIDAAINTVETTFNGSRPAPLTPDFTWEIVPEPTRIAMICLSVL